MSSLKKVRLGVWGCGGHAVNHLKHLPDNIEVVSLCDTSAQAMAHANQEARLGDHVRYYMDSSEFLAFSNIEAVFISTPDQFHAEQIWQALEAGKHVLAEKPLATTEEQFTLLERSASLVQGMTCPELKFLTCHPRRFDPRNEWIKTSMPLLRKFLGKSLSMTFDFRYPAPSDWKNSRGLLIDHVNHEVDLMSFLLGAEQFSAERVTDTPSEYCVKGSRADGLDFFFSGSRSANIKGWDASKECLRITFEWGRVEVIGHDPHVHISQKDKLISSVRVPPRGHHFERYGDVMRNFADVVRGDAGPYVSLDQMLVNTATGVYLTSVGSYKSKIYC